MKKFKGIFISDSQKKKFYFRKIGIKKSMIKFSLLKENPVNKRKGGRRLYENQKQGNKHHKPVPNKFISIKNCLFSPRIKILNCDMICPARKEVEKDG